MKRRQDELSGITRRDFTVKSALAILSSVPIALTACGSDSPPSPTAPTARGDVRGTVGANHGHEAVVTGAALTAGNAVTLNIMGTADHLHTVELSANEISQIAAGGRVQKESSNNVAHAHTVTFN